ncbi:MAG: DUF2339 domain-containing protein [Gammaproteobacteria bacterium HGW-Gammaproteobacteria-11]|nr:MAG: DUF2339 domain-containing protein [Gammaproteobacteria bacterium HGW-Gammaproteobacteria-11]
MGPLLVFIFVGMLLGALMLELPGVVLGAVIGYLLAQLGRQSADIKALRTDLDALRQRSTASPAAVQPPPQAAETSPADTEQPLPQGTDDAPLEWDFDPQPAQSASAASMAPQPRPEPATAWAASQTTATAAPASVEPSNDLGSRIEGWIRRFLTEGNPIVRIGMVVMFFGLGFLIKYVSSQGLFPIEMRLASVAVVACILLAIGWRTRHKPGGYGLVLQGGGIATLYLTVFAATKLFPLLPSGTAFALMFLIVMLGALMAVLQNAQVLALMATSGGFMAPVLTSDGGGSHVTLFSFYLLLNLGVLSIAWFKRWRLLNWVGFVFTFGITSAWAALKFQPDWYLSSQLFLIGFFLQYLLVSLLFSLRQPPQLRGLVDATLVFGLPIIGFGIQSILLEGNEYALATSAALLATLYWGLALWLWRSHQPALRLLTQAFMAIGLMFATLAIPLALDAQWTSASWALEAAGLIWIGLRQQHRLPRLAGYLLYLAACLSLFWNNSLSTGELPLVQGDFLGLLILSIAALSIALMLETLPKHSLNSEKGFELAALIIGWSWWILALLNEVDAHLARSYFYSAMVLAVTLSTLGLLLLGQRLQWRGIERLGFWLLPSVLIWSAVHMSAMLIDIGSQHPSATLGLIALPAFFALHYCVLWWQRERPGQALLKAWHSAGYWLFAALLVWEARWWQLEMGWQDTSAAVLWFAALAAPLLLLLSTPLWRAEKWPLSHYRELYLQWIAAPLLALLGIWYLFTSTLPGTSALAYLPLLNPLDLLQGLSLLLLIHCYRSRLCNLAALGRDLGLGLIGLCAFSWLNLLVLRAMAHYSGVDYVLPSLWQSLEVQMALSILWSLCALLVMYLARRFQARELWFAGAALLCIIVLKLFTKDLTGTGTLTRIVSFMAVGSLMLLIGYLSPLPGRQGDKQPVPETEA